jgi:hypothetical protein
VDVRLAISAEPPFKLSPFKAIDCEGRIIFSSREGVVISPDEVALRFHVPSLWELHWRKLLWIPVILLVLRVIIGIIGALTKFFEGPSVTGTPSYWMEAAVASPVEVNLDKFDKGVIIIGRGHGFDILGDDLKLNPQHAKLTARKEEKKVVVELCPIGDSEVYKDFRLVTGPTPLRHEDEFQMGDYTFRYLKVEE